MRLLKCTVLLMVAMLRIIPAQLAAQDKTLDVTVGEHRVVFPSGYQGLTYFPDEPIAIVNQKPFQYLMTAGNLTVLMQGRNIEDARPVKQVLLPGKGGEFDNGYAGVAAAYFDKSSKKLIAFYHAEDHVGMPKVSYNKDLQGAYWSVGMAMLEKGATTFKKAGPILTSNVAKADVTQEHQGIGNPCVIADATNTYLYAYFTDLTRNKKSFAAKIGMARCLITDDGRPGKWFKYYDGRFTEKGLGGKGAPVVPPPANLPSDVIAPSVTYIPSMKKYFMLCCLMVYSDHEKQVAEKGGIYFCSSDDGIRWTEPRSLVTTHPIPYQGREFVGYPQLLIDKVSDGRINGRMLYTYSPRWGTTAPNQPHHLAKRRITISVSEKEDSSDDVFRVGSIWKGEPKFKNFKLTVLERIGDRFQARFENKSSVREVSGTAKDRKVSWSGKDVKVIQGNAGADNEGTIVKDDQGTRIDFVWRGGGKQGTFTLHRQD